MTTQIANATDNSREARIQRARALAEQSKSAPIASSDGKTKTPEQLALEAELKAVKIKHPVTGKMVSATYFSESLIAHGFTIVDHLEANYVTREKYEELEAKYNELLAQQKAAVKK